MARACSQSIIAMSPACFTHSARRPWTSRRDFDAHRGQNLLDKCHMAGEGLSNYAFGAQVPEFQGVPATMTDCTERPLVAACYAMNTMTPSSNQMMLMWRRSRMGRLQRARGSSCVASAHQQ